MSPTGARLAAVLLLAADMAVGGGTNMQARVRRDPDKTWIEGIRGFDSGEFADSVHGCQARILQHLGESVTYDDLIGYNGFAFRVGLHKALCPSAGHPCCGFSCIQAEPRVNPWRTRTFMAMPGGKPRPDQAAFEAEACAAIRQSIDAGIPVHYGSEEDGLIIGYGDEGRRWWCLHPYHRNGREPFWHDQGKGMAGGKWPWGITIYTAPKPAAERTPERDLLVSALRQAVTMWQTPAVGDYACGAAAYGKWIEWLQQVEMGQVKDPKAGMQGNAWGFNVLAHSRRIAGRWLATKAATLGDHPARPHLSAAGAAYDRLTDACTNGLACTWDLALPPGRFDKWTSAMRQDQLRRLTLACDADAAAIGEIQKALERLQAP